ncbi:MAG: DUF1751 domain-containing protein, partial [Xanthomonadaceae bacterium]|nr:DUF1751 domain-containing protein [Xanthomonadaceae bacterium]
MSNLPAVTRALLIANIAIFLLQMAGADSAIIAHFALWPLGPHQLVRMDDGSVMSLGFQPWQLITYSFLH